MTCDFLKINWHDMGLKKVEENTFEHVLIWHVSYDSSEDSDGSKYENKIIVFHGANCHYVEEGDVFGDPTILDGKIESVEIMYSQKSKMTFSTTAGKRVVYANSVNITNARA